MLVNLSKVCLLLILLFGCAKKKLAPTEKVLQGINGQAKYLFNADGEVIWVFKEEYNSANWSIGINRDTIEFGSDFNALVGVSRKHFKLIVSNPSTDTISNAPGDYTIDYKYTPTSRGMHEFRGVLISDSLRQEFQFNFVVK